MVTTNCVCSYLFLYIGSIELQQRVTISKADQTKTDEVYLCGFVLKYLLPSKMSWSLDPLIVLDIEILSLMVCETAYFRLSMYVAGYLIWLIILNLQY